MLLKSSILTLAMLAAAPVVAQTHETAVRDVHPVRLCVEQGGAHPAVATDRTRCVLLRVRSPVAKVRGDVIGAAPSDAELRCRVSGECGAQSDGATRS